MLFLGIDLGTSSIKVSVVDADTQQVVAAATYPDTETAIQVPQEGWAEQDPSLWWECTTQAIRRVIATGGFDATDIAAIGIAYQMHGLVLVDEAGQALRPSILWCDSRAVPYGDRLYKKIGAKRALSYLLNSPGSRSRSAWAYTAGSFSITQASLAAVKLPGELSR